MVYRTKLHSGLEIVKSVVGEESEAHGYPEIDIVASYEYGITLYKIVDQYFLQMQ